MAGKGNKVSGLAKSEIEEYMRKPLLSERLTITPILDPENQVRDTGVDVRLGNEFIVVRRTTFSTLDPAEKKEVARNIGRYQGRIKIDFKEKFILHPNHLVLGSTLEYIALPKTLSAYVVGRSSWGRLGLIIATAISIAPGFKGCLTLELENIGEVPITLYPGLLIAQLVFNKVEGKCSYSGRYNYPTGPEFSRVLQDRDLEFWVE